ncbi:hypothetical protein BaRGS_00005516 [Batillaria attramentaria]|uniref:Ribosomal protein S10 n=1 Tax=Batillaria attramentaria TaxID=370345 RepID=A0ABD0LVY1_9CAEN
MDRLFPGARVRLRRKNAEPVPSSLHLSEVSYRNATWILKGLYEYGVVRKRASSQDHRRHCQHRKGGLDPFHFRSRVLTLSREKQKRSLSLDIPFYTTLPVNNVRPKLKLTDLSTPRSLSKQATFVVKSAPEEKCTLRSFLRERGPEAIPVCVKLVVR